MLKLSLSVLVFRCADIDKSRACFQALGLKFTQEQHGTGPVHYSCETASSVIEIYPGKPGSAPDRRNAGATMIGFQVVDMDNVLSHLQDQGITILTALQDSEWGRRAVVQDPDSRAIELSQPPFVQ